MSQEPVDENYLKLAKDIGKIKNKINEIIDELNDNLELREVSDIQRL